MDVGPDVAREGHQPQQTIRLDYATTFTIKCAEGHNMKLSQPKHLSFVKEGNEWLIYEYGREADPQIAITPAS